MERFCRHGKARYGLARSGTVWQAWYGKVGQGRSRPGTVRRGMAGLAGGAWLVQDWFDGAR